MKTIQQKNTIGSLRISKEVIMTIAQASASEVTGVAGFSSATVDMKNLILKNWTLKPVVVTLADDIAVIDIYIILKQGTRIPTVAKAVQIAIKESVQSMTGIAVSKVNVIFSGVSFEEDDRHLT